MRRTASALLVAGAVCIAVVGCSKVIKPGKPGAYLVANEKLTELPVFIVDSDLSSEGFSSYSFTDEPKVEIKPGAFYFILFGDMKPQGMREFKRVGNKYELDNSKPMPPDAMEISLMKGETRMYKVGVSKTLPLGTYVIDMQKGTNTVSVAFKLAY